MHVFHVFAVTHPLMAALLLFILIPAVLVYQKYPMIDQQVAFDWVFSHWL